jgi:DNA gyrase/topoisomerase IV subunit B
VQESYVNLIPTTQGGTHVNGLRTGLVEALREFCEYRNLLPRGVRLAPEDVWERSATCSRSSCSTRSSAARPRSGCPRASLRAFVSGVIKDAFSLWLNQHVDQARGHRRAGHRQRPEAQKAAARWCARRSPPGPALPGKLADCTSPGPGAQRAVPGGGRLRRRLRQAGARPRVSRPSCRCAARSSTPGRSTRRGAGLPGGARHLGGHRRRSRAPTT